MPILEAVATSLFSYGLSKGWKHIFESKPEYAQELEKVIEQTVEDYAKEYPIQDSSESFAFYKSRILLEELLKFRLFERDGHLLDQSRVQEALLQNPNIVRPTEQQLEIFFSIFIKNVKSNDQLRKLEIEEYVKDGSTASNSNGMRLFGGIRHWEYGSSSQNMRVITKKLRLVTKIRRFVTISFYADDSYVHPTRL